MIAKNESCSIKNDKIAVQKWIHENTPHPLDFNDKFTMVQKKRISQAIQYLSQNH